MKTYLATKDSAPEKAAFPVIDAHNHLWGRLDKIPDIVKTMDECGVSMYCDLTANMRFEMRDGGYVFMPADINGFLRAAEPFKNRLYCFTTATFARDTREPLFDDINSFAEETAAVLEADVKAGAKGLKILKELGLKYKDSSGSLVKLDDKGLDPVWSAAARLGVPVLIHQADPDGFFDPVTKENEHYETLLKYPSWSFADPKFPRKDELIARRNAMIKRHPGTIFILPHIANSAENLGRAAKVLDDCPNVYIDFSARIDELGRQPYSARDFLIKYQDRVLFGSDLRASPEMYRCFFRFLETFDEWFQPPDYDGSFARARWNIHGLGLPEKVLRKIYRGNALKIMPSLKAAEKQRL
jgi:predicted TIM-barrel fold metal-dependent hydrolase